jgi:hypothetical protein
MSALEELENRFAYHPAKTPDRREHHEDIRARCFEVAKVFHFTLPQGRELALAITKLEEAMFWANAALAREGGEPVALAEAKPIHQARDGEILCATFAYFKGPSEASSNNAYRRSSTSLTGQPAFLEAAADRAVYALWDDNSAEDSLHMEMCTNFHCQDGAHKR